MKIPVLSYEARGLKIQPGSQGKDLVLQAITGQRGILSNISSELLEKVKSSFEKGIPIIFFVSPTDGLNPHEILELNIREEKVYVSKLLNKNAK